VAAFINSPEGKEAERKREADRSSAQQLHDALMAKLPSLDMSNDVAVLDWLCQMQGPSFREVRLPRWRELRRGLPARRPQKHAPLLGRPSPRWPERRTSDSFDTAQVR